MPTSPICKFSDLQGDAIEWNVAINDSDILISDHIIERINCTNGKINWGIGIGLAGSTYDNNYPEDQAVKKLCRGEYHGIGLSAVDPC
ncbi:colanic acid biosynthesis protein [Escherichia coli]|uniref:Colanic acid biosynthesis protein n=1 Tax=Escherichia coli TaxID=562 RepID=A0A376KRI0_ECOLX|nr:colanic acid biosynthesis protein [Escherichia coli]